MKKNYRYDISFKYKVTIKKSPAAKVFKGCNFNLPGKEFDDTNNWAGKISFFILQNSSCCSLLKSLKFRILFFIWFTITRLKIIKQKAPIL